jgi:Zn-dependent peptidase ImmA (M78 family)
VAVVFVAEIGKSRVSGSAWWATPARAVIQLSDRYKHEDNFWFAFFHEAAHILLHSKKETFIDDGSEDDELEAEANRFAANTLIAPADAASLGALASDLDVELFADRVGVSPGIVVGRLHNDGLWDWGKGNHLRRRVEIDD